MKTYKLGRKVGRGGTGIVVYAGTGVRDTGTGAWTYTEATDDQVSESAVQTGLRPLAPAPAVPTDIKVSWTSPDDADSPNDPYSISVKLPNDFGDQQAIEDVASCFGGIIQSAYIYDTSMYEASVGRIVRYDVGAACASVEMPGYRILSEKVPWTSMEEMTREAEFTDDTDPVFIFVQYP
jgi:hypothetical protein